MTSQVLLQSIGYKEVIINHGFPAVRNGHSISLNFPKARVMWVKHDSKILGGHEEKMAELVKSLLRGLIEVRVHCASQFNEVKNCEAQLIPGVT
jgi:hypothetical protein